MKYTSKKKLIAMMALLIVAASFSGCNSANTAAMIDPEVTSSEIVSSEATSSEAISSAPVSSEEEKTESEAASSEAEVSSKPAVTSEPAVSSAPVAVSESAATSQPVSSTVSSAPVEGVAQTSSVPPAQTASAPTQQQSGSTKAFEDMTIEEQDQWLLDQLNQQLGSMEVHDSGIVERHSIESTQPAESDNDDAEHKALEKEKLEQLRQSLQGAQNEQKTEQEVSQTEEQDLETNPTEEQETVSEATGDVYEAIRLINKERAKAGLNELEIDDTLMEMAAVRAKEISVNYAHARADGSELRTIFEEFGYNYCSAAENIYASPSTASRAVSGWMNSSGHKANILHPYATRVGVGYYFDKNSASKHHWVMLATD